LAEILQRAEVTKGAFYYHFDSKEAVASAIIEEAFQKIRGAADAVIESSSPALQNVILATFAVARVTESDTAVRVGKQLAQSLTQVSDGGPKAFEEWTTRFVGQVQAAITPGDCGDLEPAEVGEDAVGDDVYPRLARSWRVLLGGIVPQSSLPYFRDFVARTYQAYAHSSLPAQ
jgi:AcrR family transcriptional regulator